MVYNVPVYDIDGEKQTDQELDQRVFNQEVVNESLIHEAVLKKRTNERHPIADTKTRGQVKVSGKKLYRQKGTGRARVGDAGSPIRKGGGVSFGATKEKTYNKKMPQKMRRRAMFGAMSLKAEDDELYILDEYKYDEIKTQNAVNTIENIGLSDESVLVVIGQKDEIIEKSFRNMEDVEIKLANYLHPYDLLTSKNILFVDDALDVFRETFIR